MTTGPSRVATAQTVALAVTGIMLMAATMRGPITSVGPVLETIRADVGLSAAGAGVLSMLPLLAFAAVSPVAPGFARRIGLERSLGVALAVLVVGSVVRSVPGRATLFGGTALIGIAIGLINVLLSALIKRDYPERAAALTGMYTMVMGALAMTGSGIVLPVAQHVPGGWRTSLALWALLALVALIAWLPRLRGAAGYPTEPGRHALHRSWLAWQLTAFMGLQSLGFYVSVAWLPTILHANGVSPTGAGWHVALMQLTGLLASATAPLVLARMADQRAFAAGAAVLGVLSFLSFVVLPDLSWVWSGTVGVSQGVGITLALSFFALRARDARQAAVVSGMGQSLGYLLAAFGPLLFGVLHDATGGWGIPLVILAALIGVQALVALGAGRARQLSA